MFGTPVPKTYLVAKANETARAFVVRSDHPWGRVIDPSWIILDKATSYQTACIMRDDHNSGDQS